TVSAAGASIRADRELTAAEALGLGTPTSAPVPVVVAARTPIEKLLGHAAWVDAQLSRAARPSDPREVGRAPYVFVAAPVETRTVPVAGKAAPKGETPSLPIPAPDASLTPVAAPSLVSTSGVSTTGAPGIAVAPVVAAAPSPFALPGLSLTLGLAAAPSL